MKRTLAIAFSALALAASAGMQKVASLQVADTETLARGVTKIGELTGNMMLGMMAAPALGKLPGVELFGPGRAGAASLYCFFLDDAFLSKVEEAPDDAFAYALLYPVTQTREAFVKDHAGCKDENGVLSVTLSADDDDDDAEKETVFVAFSKDGKWAVMCDKAAQAKAVLDDVRLAERPMKGDLVKAVVLPKGVDAVRQILEKAEKELKKDGKGNDFDFCGERLKEVMKGIAAILAGLTVDDHGLVFHGSVGTVKGSELAKCGQKSLKADCFAFAPKSALVAVACAEDCGQQNVELEKVLAMLARHGIKTDSFLIEEKKGSDSVITLDVPAAIAYVKSATNELAKIDWKTVKKDFRSLAGEDKFGYRNPVMGGAVAVKGYEAPCTPAERFAVTMPEAAALKPFNMQVFSVYSLLKALLPAALAEADEAERAALKPILATLPPEGKGAIAAASWREGDKLNGRVRISADELKSLAAGFSAISAYQMRKAMEEAQKEQSTKAK